MCTVDDFVSLAPREIWSAAAAVTDAGAATGVDVQETVTGYDATPGSAPATVLVTVTVDLGTATVTL